MTTSEHREHRAAKRTIELIELVAAAGAPLSLASLARQLALPKSSAHSLVRTLAAEGYLDRADDGGYALGSRIIRLLSQRQESYLPHVAEPVMRRLGRRGRRDGDPRHAPAAVRCSTPRRSRRPSSCATSRRSASCARCTPRASARSCSPRCRPRTARRCCAVLGRFTEFTTTDVDALLAEIGAIRAQGFALNREESIAGVTGVAAPVYATEDGSPRNVGGLSVVGPAARMRTKLPAVIERLTAATREIGSGL